MMWIEHLNGLADPNTETASACALLGSYEATPSDETDAWTNAHAEAFGALHVLALRGAAATEGLMATLRGGRPLAIAKQQVAELTRIDEEARLFAELHPACRPLTTMARFERDNLEGADPLALAETTMEIYRACAERARLMALKLHRIQQIQQGGA
jgi:hypothetical protein